MIESILPPRAALLLFIGVTVKCSHQYEVNLKSELEILSLRKKLDELSEKKWIELIVMQHEQIQLVTQLLKERGVVTKASEHTGYVKTNK